MIDVLLIRTIIAIGFLAVVSICDDRQEQAGRYQVSILL